MILHVILIGFTSVSHVFGCVCNIIDVDECGVNNGGCQHTCVSSEGTHHCECKSGYQLNSDGRTCTGIFGIVGMWYHGENDTGFCFDLCSDVSLMLTVILPLHPVLLYDVIMHPAVSYDVIMHPAVSYHVIMDPAVSYHVIMHPAVSYHVIMHPAVSYHVIMHPAVSYHVIMDPAVSYHHGSSSVLWLS